MLGVLKKFTVKNWLSVLAILAFTFGQVYFTMQIVTGLNTLTEAVQRAVADDIWAAGLQLVIFALLMVVCQIAIQFFASATAADAATRLRGDLYRKANRFALSDFAAFSTESLITRTTNDVQNVHLALLTALRTVFVAPIMIICSLIALMKVDAPQLTTVVIIWLSLLIIVVIGLMIMLMPKFKVVQVLTDELNIASRENLTGVRVVRAFNAEKYQEAKFYEVNKQYTKLQIFVGRLIAFFTPFILFVMMGLNLCILLVSGSIISAVNQTSHADALAFFNATSSFIMLAAQIVMAFVLLVTLIVIWPRANVSARRITEILNHPETVLDPETSEAFTEKGTIEFRNVSFTYPGGASPAVSDISFKVKKGEVIAFIGATGSGKTTIINMIPRMTDCTTGEVLVDGVNVRNVKQEDLRARIGYAPQKAFLFKGILKDNIAFSNPDMGDEEILRASKIAEADSFISLKRKGYDSEVAQGGTNYSGGQKQRICIARAVAGSPEILIFDDSFSALDYKTDKMVRTNIANEMPEATRVIIAQRVGTIMDADQIVVLDKGRMVGIGKHKELLETCGVYREIAMSQMTKEELGL